MERGPLKVDKLTSHSADQGIPCLSRNPMVHYTVSTDLNPTRSILILHSHLRLGLASGLFLLGRLITILYALLTSPISSVCRVRLIFLDFITRRILGVTVLDYGLDDQELESRQGLGIFLNTASRPALEPTQPPIQWVPRTLSLGVRLPGREDDHSPPSSAEVNA
jgi:hypothetical protein